MGIKKEDAEASKKEIKENRDKDESQMSSTEKVPHGSNEPLRRSPQSGNASQTLSRKMNSLQKLQLLMKTPIHQ